MVFKANTILKNIKKQKLSHSYIYIYIYIYIIQNIIL
jgi:hypothetical protein